MNRLRKNTNSIGIAKAIRSKLPGLSSHLEDISKNGYPVDQARIWQANALQDHIFDLEAIAQHLERLG